MVIGLVCRTVCLARLGKYVVSYSPQNVNEVVGHEPRAPDIILERFRAKYIVGRPGGPVCLPDRIYPNHLHFFSNLVRNNLTLESVDKKFIY